jgi:hypothetical protein
VTLAAPADGAEVLRDTVPTFAWNGSGGAVSYRISFSGFDSFRRVVEFPSPRKVISDTVFTPSASLWRRIVRQAGRNGAGNIYWWVTAFDANGAQRTSLARHLVTLHENVSTTIFWVGEPAAADNGYIANDVSAWDECWQAHYGGVDDPTNRSGYLPSAFTPAENPFYVALPYDDLDGNGAPKWNVADVVPWAKTTTIPPTDSAVKNHWVKIAHGGNTCYAQWEDVGPFKDNDFHYVFGPRKPRSRVNQRAGLDVSPAVRDCLGLTEGISPTNWRFVDESEVPAGPWTSIVTTSQLDFNPPSCP